MVKQDDNIKRTERIVILRYPFCPLEYNNNENFGFIFT